MTRGTIVLTPFPFTDLSAVKRRVGVIVSNPKRQGNDVILAFITSKIEGILKDTDYILKDTHPDFKATGLKKTSVFKMDKLVTLEKRVLIGEIGKASPALLQELDKRLKIALDI